jgi:anti-sigma factor RsiW
MPAQPRGRACQNCQSIKIKCELGAAGGGPPPCERCVRLGKTCTLAPPKRQKDRVAELEAKVEALTKLLNAQGLQDPTVETRRLPTPSTGTDEQSEPEVLVASQKKRKLETSVYERELQNSTDDSSPEGLHADIDDPNVATRLDRLVSVETQQRVLDEYIASYQSVLPVVPLPGGTKIESLRETMPHVLHAIVYIASCGLLPWDLQDKINVSLIEDLTSKTLAQCKKSKDLLLALQLVCLWYRSPRNSTQIPLFQLVHISSDMAIDLGFGGYQNPPSLSIAGMQEGLLGGMEPCRVWLISFIISDTVALLRRKANDQKWSLHHDYCLAVVESNGRGPEDNHLLWLAQHARAARILATISDEMDLQTALISPVVGTPTCQQIMYVLQSQITAWRLQVPADLWSSSLTFTGFYMELILNEPVLHTPTNKNTFAAPFLIERVSITDFPAPVLTQHHTHCVRALTSACHSLLDVATSFTGVEMISLPSLTYAPRVAHAAVTLLKLHVAVTVPGNTYGQVLSAEEVNTEAYLDKCLELVARGIEVDSQSVLVRIVKYASELKKWLQQYESIRLTAGEHVDGRPIFHQAFGEQVRNVGEADFNDPVDAESSTEETNAQGTIPKFEDDAAFADFVNLDFAMDDYGLFDLFYEPDLGANTFET